MSRSSKILYGLSIMLCSVFTLAGQDCAVLLQGTIKDEGTGLPLPYASVFIEEEQRGVIADSLGRYMFHSLCKRDYHVVFRHVGCAPYKQYLRISGDSTVNVVMHHHTELMDEIVVHGDKKENTTQVSNAVGRKKIISGASKDMSEVLEDLAGVDVLRTGVGISKPIIHGLYGNRVSVMNNGIPQSGQQWGNDHAPEIDAFMSDHLSVVKGSSALAYGGSSLGGVVLVEMDPIHNDPHLHGDIRYGFDTNGRGHVSNARVEKYGSWAGWRAAATWKKVGDRRSPDYFLKNTGKEERNASFQWEKQVNTRLELSGYYSLFHATIGILRGAHVSTKNDLEEALVRKKPFYTEDHFSYELQAPKQQVIHHLLKMEAQISNDKDGVLRLSYGGQWNDRKEFDIRRAGRSEIPALSLHQYSHFLEAVVDQPFKSGITLKSGFQGTFTDNTNDPETGILPLIPDYRSYQGAGFIIFQKEGDHWLLDGGTRLDWIKMDVWSVSSRELEIFNHHFLNVSFSGGIKYQVIPSLKATFNMGFMKRSPQINELHSAGLHQGVSGIEVGDPFLQSEKSLKNILSFDWSIKNKVFFQLLGFYQVIDDYIFLQPQQDPVVTIRGTFPIYTYRQTDAILWGTDVLVSYEPLERWRWLIKYSFVRGDNTKEHIPLVYMPPPHTEAIGNYSFPGMGKLKENTVSASLKYVFEQTHWLADQDIAPPPKDYFLLNVGFRSGVHFKKSVLTITMDIQNALNTPYRNYLNRQRYFADELGRNFQLGLIYSF